MELPDILKPTDELEVFLPSGTMIDLPICHPIFTKRTGNSSDFDYGRKPLLDYKSKAYFAELIILNLLLENGWDGVWVESYGGTHFLRSMPKDWNLQSEHVTIPKEKETMLREIWKRGGTKACFDVFAWKGDQLLFFEGKRSKKDRLTRAQLKFIEGALNYGLSASQLIIVEWFEK
jgi:hypothetical protein